MKRRNSARALRRLEGLKLSYGDGVAGTKLELLGDLERAVLANSSQVVRLHEMLCFLRAYPDDLEVLAVVERMLEAFDRRRDLRRHRRELESTGIAGTTISYSFYWFTALWLARQWPALFHIDWDAFEKEDLLASRLVVLMSYSESLALEEAWLETREWVDRLKGLEETDAAFVVARFAALETNPFWREQIFEELDVPCRLEPGPTTPSRSRARYEPSPVVTQEGALETSRDSFPGALWRRPRSVRAVNLREAAKLITLAREAMITRSRDLDVFVHADRRDVRLMDCGRGLQFVCCGTIPERRQMLDAVYGFLILKNGVPIGYFLTSALYRSALVAYNIFETYRGAEAAYVYGRGLAMVRHIFDVDSFGIETYQLGHNNQEALESGAWWFYYKLGFRPRERAVLRIVAGELRKMKKNPRHRSTVATLRKLAAVEMYLGVKKPGQPGRSKLRNDIVGLIARENVGFRVIRYLAERFGADREHGIEVCAREAAKLLGVRSRSRFTPGERLAWNRWAPLVMILPRAKRWSANSKARLVEVIRAKGGARESEFVALFDRHRALRRAILELAEDQP
ncbi:MAG: hypothetical protein IH936_12460 [Acidobacteria bacterium]|nr:hypothetical protein [Acidobacteriota bacterium]